MNIEYNTPEVNEENDEQEKYYVPEIDDEPLKIEPPDRRLVTQPYDFSVKTIVSQIDDKSLNTRPSFQRGYVWDDQRASRLIESLLLNIPIPVCYFAEEESGVFTVIDGHQRLWSIWRFVNNHFPLKGLRILPEYNKQGFKDLPEKDQRLIMGRYIRCIVITQESHPEIRFEVFERLNTGSMQATDQEIRNSVYRGDFNDLIKVLASSQIYRQILGKEELDKRMRDEELVLRFFAVNEKYLSYQPPIRSFLDNFAREKTIKKDGHRAIRIRLSQEEKDSMTELFNQTMVKILVVFGDHPFRAYIEGKWEKQINRPLFDAVTLVFSKLPQPQLAAKARQVEDNLKELFANPDFSKATSGSKAHRENFFTRITMFSRAMAEIGLDSGIHQGIEEKETKRK